MEFWQEISQDAQQIQSHAVALAHAENADASIPPPPYPQTPNGIDVYYADIPVWYQPFSALPDPASYQPMLDALRRAMEILRVNVDVAHPIDKDDNSIVGVSHPEFDKLAGGAAIMDKWNGAAAESFKENFLSPFPSYTQNQFMLVAMLKSAVEAHQALWVSARTDIRNIIKGTNDALDGSPTCNQNAWTMTFTVLAAIASVASAPLGGVEAITIAAVGAAASLAGAAVPMMAPGTDTVQLSGGKVYQVIDSMKSAMDGLQQRITQGQAKISACLQTGINALQDQATRNQFYEAPRPSLADMSPGQASGNDGLGQPG